MSTDWAAAADALRQGLVVAIPTDTVYGVAVDPTIDGATDRLFAAKARPPEVALPVLCADAAQAQAVAAQPLPPELTEQWWPGGLTLVVRRSPAAAGWDLGGDSATVGLRCPAHDGVRELCRRIGPLATTSANLHGLPTPPSAAEVAAELGEGVALVIDGGTCEGAPSTVVDLTGDAIRILREGVIPADRLLARD